MHFWWTRRHRDALHFRFTLCVTSFDPLHFATSSCNAANVTSLCFNTLVRSLLPAHPIIYSAKLPLTNGSFSAHVNTYRSAVGWKESSLNHCLEKHESLFRSWWRKIILIKIDGEKGGRRKLRVVLGCSRWGWISALTKTTVYLVWKRVFSICIN